MVLYIIDLTEQTVNKNAIMNSSLIGKLAYVNAQNNPSAINKTRRGSCARFNKSEDGASFLRAPCKPTVSFSKN